MADGDPNYLRAAFLNAYNLSLVGAAAVATWMTGDWLVGAAAVGLEALWLVLGSDLPGFKRAVKSQEYARRQQDERRSNERLQAQLPEREWHRAQALDQLRADVERDLAANPSFQAVLLQSEVAKLSQLQQSFVRLAYASRRAESYLANVDVNDLARQSKAQADLADQSNDPMVRDLAKKNSQVLTRRVAAMKDIDGFVAKAKVQLSLIENSVRLLRDQALTMTSPDQLTFQLDDLLSGVEAVQQSARDAEELFGNPVSEIPVSDVSKSPTRVRN